MNEKRKVLSIKNTHIKFHEMNNDNEISSSKENLIEEICPSNNNDINIENQEITQINHQKIFKKTLSRVVFIQLIDWILSDECLRKEISTENLENQYNELIEFIIENNFHEWKVSQNKQLAKNFIHDLFVIFNKNFHIYGEYIKQFCQNNWELYIKDNDTALSIIYGGICDFIYSESKKTEQQKSEKDLRSIICHEYAIVAEYFMEEGEIKFIIGILNTIFDYLDGKNQVDKENES